MRPSLFNAFQISLPLNRPDLVLALNSTGMPETVDPDATLLKAQYIHDSSTFEEELNRADANLQGTDDLLLAIKPHGDRSGNRLAHLFKFEKTKKTQWVEDQRLNPARNMKVFFSVQADSKWSWDHDFSMNRPGMFLTGRGDEKGLWRIVRYEIEASNRPLFTLSAVILLPDFPSVDFSQLGSSIVKSELDEQFQEFQQSIAAIDLRGAVTKARNITEALLKWRLESKGQEPGRDLAGHLRICKEIREKVAKEKEAPISDLTYHLAHKIRILHAWTHTDRAQEQGRHLPLDLASTVVQDLKEILTDLGLEKQ